MDDGSRLPWIIAAVLVLCAAYCAMAETAFASASRPKLKVAAGFSFRIHCITSATAIGRNMYISEINCISIRPKNVVCEIKAYASSRTAHENRQTEIEYMTVFFICVRAL